MSKKLLALFLFLVPNSLIALTFFKEYYPYPTSPNTLNQLSLFAPGSRDEVRFSRLMGSSEYIMIGAHGAGNREDGIKWIEDQRFEESRFLTPSALARHIEEETKLRDLGSSMPIVLLSCNAGAGPQPYAQQLADLIGRVVYAADGYVKIDWSGSAQSGGGYLSTFFATDLNLIPFLPQE